MDLKTFPQLGAFSNELSSNNVAGGIGGSWPMNLPLNYWWNFGSSKKSTKKRTKSTKKRTKSTKKRTKSTKKRSKSRVKKSRSKKQIKTIFTYPIDDAIDDATQ
jgi:hypothetical protein